MGAYYILSSDSFLRMLTAVILWKAAFEIFLIHSHYHEVSFNMRNKSSLLHFFPSLISWRSSQNTCFHLVSKVWDRIRYSCIFRLKIFFVRRLTFPGVKRISELIIKWIVIIEGFVSNYLNVSHQEKLSFCPDAFSKIWL